MDEKLREQLDMIDEWLCDPRGGRELADVLTALRGPDSCSETVKWHTTQVIRSAAFPKLRRTVNETGWLMRDPEYQLSIKVIDDASDHFNRHVRSAAQTLGIPLKSNAVD